jgi:WhiB family redox-sensing transcriptional regulator
VRLATVVPVLTRWWDHAACKGMDLTMFISEPNERYSVARIREAKAVCATCLVRPECLKDSLQYSTSQLECYGIWGGLTWRERKELQQTLIRVAPMVYSDATRDN